MIFKQYVILFLWLKNYRISKHNFCLNTILHHNFLFIVIIIILAIILFLN